MGLKSVLSSKAELEALPEAVRGFYVDKGGQFVLDADVEDHPAAAALKSALNKERESKETLDKELKKLRKDVEGLDPEKAREAMRRITELEEKKLLDEGKVEEVVRQRTERLNLDHQQQVTEFQKKLTELEKGNHGLLEELATERIDNAITLKATKAGARPTAVTDIILRARRVWRLENGKPVPKEGDTIIYGKDPSKPMEMDEWLEGLRKGDGAHLFEGSGGGGAQTGTRIAGNNVVLNREAAKDPQLYRAAKEQAAKQGGTVVIEEMPVAH